MMNRKDVAGSFRSLVWVTILGLNSICWNKLQVLIRNICAGAEIWNGDSL